MTSLSNVLVSAWRSGTGIAPKRASENGSAPSEQGSRSGNVRLLMM
jgi:hypothetical protein